MGTASRRARSALMVVAGCIVVTVLAVVLVLVVVGVFESAGVMITRSSPLPRSVEHNGRSYALERGTGCNSDAPITGTRPVLEINVLFGEDIVVLADETSLNVPDVLYADDGSICFPSYSLKDDA